MPSRLRLNRAPRPKVTDDVLISILVYLDPPSLWRVSRVFKRIYYLVMDVLCLRYMYELAVLGMKDGPVAHIRVPPVSRLQVLDAYKLGWRQLSWAFESKTWIPATARAGFSGGFLQQIKEHGPGDTLLELMELPSTRTNKSPASTRHLRYICPGADSISIDQVQGLLITSHVFSHQGQIGVQLHFRDLWSFKRHSRAFSLSYELSTQVSARVRQIAMMIYGSKVAVSLEFAGGKMKHLILNWHTFDARWLDDEDIFFLDETYILALKRRSSSDVPYMALYNISKPSAATLLRNFELPQDWADTIIEFCPNSSPRSDFHSSNALFYCAPETRVLAIKSRPHHGGPNAPANWLFIRESYFRHFSRKDPIHTPWKQWGQYCLVKEVASYPHSTIRGPYAIGTKVLYVENRKDRSRSNSRLHAIDFSPFVEPSANTGRSWISAGPKAALVPIEYSKPIPADTVDGLSVDEMSVTEDNIVLFTEVHHGHRFASVLTFGAVRY